MIEVVVNVWKSFVVLYSSDDRNLPNFFYMFFPLFSINLAYIF